ncbi:MAG: hypothetical protein AVDCRST_MAG10-397, partial [uncultured Acidimicrobiales bacterium]
GRRGGHRGPVDPHVDRGDAAHRRPGRASAGHDRQGGGARPHAGHVEPQEKLDVGLRRLEDL